MGPRFQETIAGIYAVLGRWKIPIGRLKTKPLGFWNKALLLSADNNSWPAVLGLNGNGMLDNGSSHCHLT